MDGRRGVETGRGLKWKTAVLVCLRKAKSRSAEQDWLYAEVREEATNARQKVAWEKTLLYSSEPGRESPFASTYTISVRGFSAYYIFHERNC